MDTPLFARFAPLLRDLSDDALETEIRQPQRLLLDSRLQGGKRIDVAYAPFEHVTPGARIVLVGLTPGRQQMGNALREARRALRQGLSAPDALAAAKVFASFSGPMRSNLVALLDGIGVHRLLGLASTASLWGADAGLVHFTSALRNPVFVDGANYSGAPSMLTTPLLREQLQAGLAAELAALPGALVVPLGPKVAEAVETLARQGVLDPARVLAGLPHPSGANAERIAFFLGRKPRAALSTQVDADKILQARTILTAKVAALG